MSNINYNTVIILHSTVNKYYRLIYTYRYSKLNFIINTLIRDLLLLILFITILSIISLIYYLLYLLLYQYIINIR